MTNLTQLRIDSARAVDKDVYVGRLSHDIKIHLPDSDELDPTWAPDLEGHETQLVKCIEWLLNVDPRKLLTCFHEPMWKLAIMRAVAEVGGKDVG